MTPKGGIRPHKRFAVRANRSEVLFVDYIAEHLNPAGRAGVIVPEGIIFQSSNAYKALRKMLVEEGYLFAVVSLPAGIFQPYSGVKTSVLLLDKQLARQSEAVLFVKVEADGYDLGAQRREIERNDLPEALKTVRAFQQDPQAEPIGTLSALRVLKSRLAQDGDYNLGGERYRETVITSHQWPMVELGEVINTVTPPQKILKENYSIYGKFPIIDQSQSFIAGSTDNESAVINFDSPLIIFGDHTCAVKYVDFPFAQGADGIKIINPSYDFIPKFMYYLLRYKGVEPEGYKRHFSKLKEMIIPKPPLEVQQALVDEIEGYQKVIDGARQVVENYKPVIPIDPTWPLVKLGEVCDTILSGGTPSTKVEKYWNGYLAWISSADIIDLFTATPRRFITQEAVANSATNLIPKGNIVVVTRIGLGKLFMNDFDVCI